MGRLVVNQQNQYTQKDHLLVINNHACYMCTK